MSFEMKKSFIEKIKQWSPNLPDETEEYRKFYDIYIPTSFVFTALVPYILLYIFEMNSLSQWW